MIIAETQLTRRTDHPVREMSVRVAGGDRETSRQRHPATRRRRDPDLEIVGTADDAAGAGLVVVLADVDSAVANGLAVGVLLDSKETTVPMTSGPLTSEPVAVTVSTSRPARISASDSDRPLAEPGRSAKSRSQLSGALIVHSQRAIG